jgi:hypothetical protein
MPDILSMYVAESEKRAREREREREMIRKVTATRELTHQSTDLGL